MDIITYALCKKYCDTHSSHLTPEQAVAAVNTYFEEHPGEIVSNDELTTILNNYAKKTDIPSLESYAKKTDIPSLSGYATEAWVEEKNYLTEHQSLSSYSLIDETGNKIELSLDGSNYDLVAKLYDKNNNLLCTSDAVNLPLESLVLDTEYDDVSKSLIITLKDGTTKTVPVSDLISGLVNESTLEAALLTKQNTLVAGTNIAIEGNTISSTASYMITIDN